MKKIVLGLFIILFSTEISAQIEGAAFTETGRGAANAFVTDYQALGINPANLGFGNEYNKKFTMGFFQVGASNYGEGLTRSQLNDVVFDPDATLTIDEKLDAAERFDNTVLSLDVSTTILGFAVNTETIGNFAFAVNAKASHYSKFNAEAAGHLFTGFIDPYFNEWHLQDGSVVNNGGPNSNLIDSTEFGLSTDPKFAGELYDGMIVRDLSYVEYAIGWGKELYTNDKLSIYGGVGVKYLQGLYVLDITLEDETVKEAYTASSPALGIDYGDGQENSPSYVTGSGYSPVGDGFGFDLGVAVEVNDQFRFSASVTDIGSITFDGNVYETRDTVVSDIDNTGITTYNIFTEFDAFSGEDGLFKWEGVREKQVTLPTKARFGAAYFLNEKFRFGLDVVLPLNEAPGNIEKAAFAAGADYLVSDIFRLSAGFAAGDNYDFRIPFGLNFAVDEGSWEFGVSTRDILYFMRDDRPNISVAAGFLRFRFGQNEVGSPSRMFN